MTTIETVDLVALAKKAIEIARRAGTDIFEIYNAGAEATTVTANADDSPHTVADLHPPRRDRTLSNCQPIASDPDPRLRPTLQRDTPAGQPVLSGAGSLIVTADGARLEYNRKADCLILEFLTYADPDQDGLPLWRGARRLTTRSPEDPSSCCRNRKATLC